MKPTNKVTAGVLAGALAAIVTWAANQFGHVTIPAEIGIAISTVFTFAVSYAVPDSTKDEA